MRKLLYQQTLKVLEEYGDIESENQSSTFVTLRKDLPCFKSVDIISPRYKGVIGTMELSISSSRQVHGFMSVLITG